MPTTVPLFTRLRRIVIIVVAVGLVLYVAWPNRRADVHLARGRLYLREGRAIRALAEFERSARLASPNWEAHFLIGEAQAQVGRGEAARVAWRNLRGSPVAARALEAAAEQARRDGVPEVALEICKQARADGLPPANFLAVEGRVLADAGDLAGAEERYRAAMELAPRRLDLTVEFARLLVRANRLTRAEDVLRAALAAHPTSTAFKVQLAELAKRQQRPAEALALYRDVVAAVPDVIPARIALMELLVLAGEWGEAEAEAKHLTGLGEAEPLAQYVLGRVAYGRRDFIAALDHLQRAKRALPRDSAVLHWLGLTQLERGELDAGVSSLRTAVLRAPNNDRLRIHLVRALWNQARFEDARFAADQIVQPLEAETDRTLLTLVLASREDTMEDLPLDTLLARAEQALADGESATAQRAAAIAHRRAPADPRPLVALGMASLAAQDTRSALGYLEEARVRAPGDAATAINRARLLDALGQPALATATLEQALDARDAQVAALLPVLGDRLVTQGQGSAAEVLVRRHGTQPHGETVALILARALLLQGRGADAGAAVDSIDSPDAGLIRVRALLAAGRETDAGVLLNELGAGGRRADLHVLRAVLFGSDLDAESVAGSADVADLVRAYALSRGDVSVRDQVAADGGRLGATLGLIALMRTDAAHTADWQRRYWSGTAGVRTDDLPAKPQAYMTALMLQMHGWPDVAWHYYTAAGAVTHPALVEPMVLCALARGWTVDALRLGEMAAAHSAPARMWHHRATLTWQLRGADAATDIVAQARMRFPDTHEFMALAGHLDRERGDSAAAVAWYRKALAAGAGPQVRNSLAWILQGRDDTLDEAQELATTAYAAARTSPAVADTLGWCYYRQGRIEEALYYSNLAVLLDPFNPDMRYHRGRALLAAGHLQAARADCEVLRAAADGSQNHSDMLWDLCGRLTG